MQIIPSSGLADAEIERMVGEAETHAAQDKARRELVEARNIADSAVYNGEKFLRDSGEALPEATREALQQQIAAVRTALEQDEVEVIREAASELQAVIQEAGAAMYQQPADAGNGSGEPGERGKPGDGDEDVIEGEFSNA